MFTTIQKHKSCNRTRRLGLLESLENRALMTADAIPFSEAAEESNIETDPQAEVQSFDADSEMAVNVAAVQIGQTDADREMELVEIAIIAQLENLRDVLAAEELAGIAEIDSFDDFVQSIDDVLNTLRDGSDFGSVIDGNSGDGYADPFNPATGELNLDGPDFDWSSDIASERTEFTDKDGTITRKEVHSDGSVTLSTRRSNPEGSTPGAHEPNPENGSTTTSHQYNVHGELGRYAYWVHDSDGRVVETGQWDRASGFLRFSRHQGDQTARGRVPVPARDLDRLVDPDQGGGIDPLTAWLLGRLDVKLPGEPDSRSDFSMSSPNQVYPGPDDALASPLTTDVQPPLDYEDIAGQPDPYEANPQNGSLENVRPISEAELSPDPGPINPGIGSIGGD